MKKKIIMFLFLSSYLLASSFEKNDKGMYTLKSDDDNIINIIYTDLYQDQDFIVIKEDLLNNIKAFIEKQRALWQDTPAYESKIYGNTSFKNDDIKLTYLNLSSKEQRLPEVLDLIIVLIQEQINTLNPEEDTEAEELEEPKENIKKAKEIETPQEDKSKLEKSLNKSNSRLKKALKRKTKRIKRLKKKLVSSR